MGLKLVVQRVATFGDGRFVTLVPKDDPDSQGCSMAAFVLDTPASPRTHQLARAKVNDVYELILEPVVDDG